MAMIAEASELLEKSKKVWKNLVMAFEGTIITGLVACVALYLASEEAQRQPDDLAKGLQKAMAYP